jgi:hypothetical protein
LPRVGESADARAGNSVVIIRFTHTHVYPGAHCSIETSSRRKALVEFSDGVVASGTVERRRRDELQLAIDAYTTARGTHIVAKRWELQREAADRWRVLKRLNS